MILHGAWRSLVFHVLNSALPPQRLRPAAHLHQQDPVSHTAQKKREEKEERKNKIKLLK